MAWEKPAEERPVWCSMEDVKSGTPTAEGVNCTTKDPGGTGPEIASLQLPGGAHGLAGDVADRWNAGCACVSEVHQPG